MTPEAGTTLCGYCERPLAPAGALGSGLRARTHNGLTALWECPHCTPKLAAIRGTWGEMIDQFAEFQRREAVEARRRKQAINPTTEGDTADD